MNHPKRCTCIAPFDVTCEFCMSLEDTSSPNFMTPVMWAQTEEQPLSFERIQQIKKSIKTQQAIAGRFYQQARRNY